MEKYLFCVLILTIGVIISACNQSEDGQMESLHKLSSYSVTQTESIPSSHESIIIDDKAQVLEQDSNTSSANNHLMDAAKIIIAKYPGTFSFGRDRNSGELYSMEISLEYGEIWFDIEGNQVERPFFISDCGMKASGFAMYELYSESKPVILVFFTSLHHGGGWAKLYRYVGGKYAEVVILAYHEEGIILFDLPMSAQFYTDEFGHILMRHGSCVNMEYGYYRVNFNDGIMYIKPILEFEWPYFYVSSSGERVGSIDDYAEHRATQNNSAYEEIFGIPDIVITSVSRLQELEFVIISSLRSDFGIE